MILTNERSSGILLHISSLPSRFSIGDLGPEAYRFVDFLKNAGQRYWQILPLTPTNLAMGNSPYSSPSAFAGNVLLISPERLITDGFLPMSHALPPFDAATSHADYEVAAAYKIPLLKEAFAYCFTRVVAEPAYQEFCRQAAFWLDDYADFVALKKHFQFQSWDTWPENVRLRKDWSALKTVMADEIAFEKFVQYIFFKQWFDLKRYAASCNVAFIGDIPIYVTYDSVDVWANPENFKLDKDRNPKMVAGVPPDYFSETGQLWGNPVYDWEYLKTRHYEWWMLRMQHCLDMYDWVRIDHFRGFAAYWEVDPAEKTAIHGAWEPGPGEDFFKQLFHRFPQPGIIAEDLGTITDDVKALMYKFGLPGMRVLMFAFGDDMQENPYLPHNHVPHCVVYTGTHDNNTVRGWLDEEVDEGLRLKIEAYMHSSIIPDNFHWQMVEMAMASVGRWVIIPMQDVLGLDASARMNTPGTSSENWRWRVTTEQLTDSLAATLRQVVERHRRF